jgi:hypothetical protein
MDYAWHLITLLPICDFVNILFVYCRDYYNSVDIAYNFHVFGSYKMKCQFYNIRFSYLFYMIYNYLDIFRC